MLDFQLGKGGEACIYYPYVSLLLEVGLVEQQGAARAGGVAAVQNCYISLGRVRAASVSLRIGCLAIHTTVEYGISDTERLERLGTRGSRSCPLVYAIHQADQYKTFILA